MFAQHIINEGHTFGPMNDTTNIIHFARKGKMLDTLEKFYIYRETKNGNQIKDRLTVQSTRYLKHQCNILFTEGSTYDGSKNTDTQSPAMAVRRRNRPSLYIECNT